MDYLLIDKMLCQDGRSAKGNVSIACIGVRKAFDSVSREWLVKMMRLHKFPACMCETVARLCKSWNTQITAMSKEGLNTCDIINFNKGYCKVTP